ncbi:MAG: hypothetical protein ACR2P0_06570 [Acidimicrobiales bacterium]
MRERSLLNSVRKHLPADERVVRVVHMWTRHRLLIPYAIAAFVAMLAVASVVGVPQWSGRVGIGLAGSAIAAMATTEYRVLAESANGLFLLRSSRIRQTATALDRKLGSDAEIELVGNNLVITEWLVDGTRYSVMKRFQADMVALSIR